MNLEYEDPAKSCGVHTDAANKASSAEVPRSGSTAVAAEDN